MFNIFSSCIYYVPFFKKKVKVMRHFGIQKKSLNSALLQFLKTSNLEILRIENFLPICVKVKLAVTFHHGEKEGAQTDPGAVAVLLRLPA